MDNELQPGDKVSWNASQGEIQGKVEKKLTKPVKIKSQAIKASADDPKYLVRSEKTGKKAAHRPMALKKVKGGVSKKGRSSGRGQ
jgi:hypothetical protein